MVRFFLTPQVKRRTIPATFPLFAGPGDRSGKIALHSKGRTACSICPDGLCSALIRSARLAANGCGRRTPEENFAAIANLRFATFRRRSAHACGCVRGRSAVTAHQAAHQDGPGSLRLPRSRRGKGSSGPLVPVPAGTSRPRGMGFNVSPVVPAPMKVTQGLLRGLPSHFSVSSMLRFLGTQ